MTALILLVLVLVAILAGVWIATLVWVYRDAERLHKPGILVTLLIGLIAWPVGLLVWLIMRGDWVKPVVTSALGASPRACPRCGRALASETAQGFCPPCLLQQAAASECGTPNPSSFVPPPVVELAPSFPELEILELIGRGGMGAVYKVRQRRLQRLAALKVLPAEVARDPSFAERFAREARVLASLNHPNIVTVYDFGDANGRYWFLMEYVDGANLRQMLSEGQITPREALAVVPPICDALQFAHDRGVVHRDIKPENILFDKSGRAKITDFGLAKLMVRDAGDMTLTGSCQALGSPSYMAPEQIEKPQTVDHRADIYSLGVVFYQMLTGELPLGRFAPPSQKVQIDVRLDEVVLKTLEKEPERRYQQVSEVKTNVETIGAGVRPVNSSASSSSPTAATDEEEMMRWKVYRRRLLATVVSILVLGVGAMLILEGMLRRQRQKVTDASADLSRLAQAAVTVRRMQSEVEAINRYTDLSNSPVDHIKAILAATPDGVYVESVRSRRGDRTRVAGKADSAALVYAFKTALDGRKTFSSSKLVGPNRGNASQQESFEIDLAVAGGAK